MEFESQNFEYANFKSIQNYTYDDTSESFHFINKLKIEIL